MSSDQALLEAIQIHHGEEMKMTAHEIARKMNLETISSFQLVVETAMELGALMEYRNPMPRRAVSES